MNHYRQGDVLLRQIKNLPKTVRPQKRTGPVVLALGEVTGHKHQIVDELDKVDVFVSPEGAMYLQVKEPVALRHEEHAAIVIPPGNYERVIQREYSPEAIRNVTD